MGQEQPFAKAGLREGCSLAGAQWRGDNDKLIVVGVLSSLDQVQQYVWLAGGSSLPCKLDILNRCSAFVALAPWP